MKFNKEAIELKARQFGDSQRALGRALPFLPWLAATVFFVAVGAGLGDVYLAKQVMTHAHQLEAETTPHYIVKREPLAEPEYMSQMQWLARLHPDVKFTPTKKGAVQVSIEDGRYHSEWLYALSSLQANGADIVWEVSDFCVGRCNGATATATVSAYRQKLVDAAG